MPAETRDCRADTGAVILRDFVSAPDERWDSNIRRLSGCRGREHAANWVESRGAGDFAIPTNALLLASTDDVLLPNPSLSAPCARKRIDVTPPASRVFVRTTVRVYVGKSNSPPGVGHGSFFKGKYKIFDAEKFRVLPNTNIMYCRRRENGRRAARKRIFHERRKYGFIKSPP